MIKMKWNNFSGTQKHGTPIKIKRKKALYFSHWCRSTMSAWKGFWWYQTSFLGLYILSIYLSRLNTFGKFWICLNFADYMYSRIYTYFSNIQGEGISTRGFTGRQIFMADIETRTSGSFKDSIWDILELRSQKLEIRSFSFLNSLNYGTLNQKNQNYQIK